MVKCNNGFALIRVTSYAVTFRADKSTVTFHRYEPLMKVTRYAVTFRADNSTVTFHRYAPLRRYPQLLG